MQKEMQKEQIGQIQQAGQQVQLKVDQKTKHNLVSNKKRLAWAIWKGGTDHIGTNPLQ